MPHLLAYPFGYVLVGAKITDFPSVRSCVIGSILLFSNILVATESAALQELRLSLDRYSYQLNSHGVDLNLLQEQAEHLEKSISQIRQEIKASSLEKPVEKRLSNLEKAQETLVADLKLLKNHFNATTESVATVQSQLKQLTIDIQSLKNSIQSMLSLLQGDQKTYIVKSGDSLGKIAQDHKTDIKTLKKINNLSTDTIFSGQRLTLP